MLTWEQHPSQTSLWQAGCNGLGSISIRARCVYSTRTNCDEGGVRKFSMFADGSLDELAAVAGGRRPEAIADEFSE